VSVLALDSRSRPEARATAVREAVRPLLGDSATRARA
jgi:hypothetical protein